MKRLSPTKKLILSIYGNNQTLIESIHHGLFETLTLKNFSPVLDLNELLAFAASSWKSREKNFGNFSDFVKNNDIYEIFKEVYKIGMPWLNKYINNKPINEYEILNPFKGDNLQERVENIDREAIDLLKEDLLKEVKIYKFLCDDYLKNSENPDHEKIVLMGFQSVYPKKGKIIENYAAEISRILKKFPLDYELEDNKLKIPSSLDYALFSEN